MKNNNLHILTIALLTGILPLSFLRGDNAGPSFDQENWRFEHLLGLETLAALPTWGPAADRYYLPEAASFNHSVDAGEDLTACPGEETTLSATATGGTPPYSYTWYTDAALTQIAGAGQSISLTIDGPWTYYVEAVDATGAASVDDVHVTVETPTVGILPECDPEGIYYILHIITDSGDNTISTSSGQPVLIGPGEWKVINILQTDSVTVNVTGAGGCTNTKEVGPPDCTQCALMVMVKDTAICENGSAELVAMVGWGFPPYTYQWSDSPDFSSNLGEQDRLTVNEPGTYYVRAAFSIDLDPNSPNDELITCEAIDTVEVGLLTPPAIELDSTVCANDNLTYSVFLTAQGANTLSADAGTVDEANAPAYVVTGIPAGQDLTVIAVNECGENELDIPAPDCDPCTLTVDIDVDTGNVCPGDTATLTATVAGNFDPPLAYLWSNGETSESIMVSPDATTTYGVTVTAGGPGTCVDSAMTTVTLLPLPTVTIDSVFCADDSLSYSAIVSVTDADMVTVNSGNLPGDPAGDQTFTVTGIDLDSTLIVTASNQCGEASDMSMAPDCTGDDECTLTVDINVDTGNVCPGDTATLTAAVAGNFDPPLAYLWSNGETSESIMVSPDAATTYGVTVTAGGPGTCVDSAMTTVTLLPLPTVTIDSVFCADDSLSYSAIVSVTDADMVTVNSGNLPGDPAGDQTFTVTGIDLDSTLIVTASNQCGEASDMNMAPDCTGDDECTLTVDINVDTGNVCPGDTATLTANVSGGFDPPLAYLWSTGETTEFIMVSPDATTTYGVTVTADGPGTCVDSTTATVTIKPLPAIIILDTICEADTAYTLVFQTTNADSSNVSSATIDETFFGNGPHTLMGIPAGEILDITAYNECDSAFINLPPPDCDLCSIEVTVDDQMICPGDTATLTANVAGGFDPPLAYLWSTGETTESITVSPDAATTYGVIVTAGGPGTCVDSTTATVTIKPLPAIIILDTICEADTAYTLVFQTTDADSSNVSSATIDETFFGNGPHTLMGIPAGETLDITAYNECDSAFINLPPPDCDLCSIEVTVDDQMICPGDTATLTANVSGGFDPPLAYLWSTGETTESIMVSPDAATTYGVTVTAGGPGTCVDSTTATVTIKPLPAIIILDTICEADTAYTLVFQTTDADSSNVSSATIDETFFGNGPHTLMGIPAGETLDITAYNECDSAFINLPPPDCDLCSIEVTVDDQMICPGDTATLTANVAGGFDPPLAYLWSTGETTESIMVSPDAATTYGVTVTAGGPGTCVDSTTATVTIKPLPAIIILDTICEADTAYTLVFQTTDADSSNVSSATIDETFFGNGPHTLMGIPAGETLDITAYNECDSAFINLPPPDCDLCSIEVTVDDQMICPGDTATLTANVAGGFDPPLAYLWSTGETTESIMVSPDAATTYGVTVTAGGPGTCVDSTTATVTIKPLPAIIILDTICEADTAYTLVFQTTDADSSNVSSATIDETFFGNGPHTLMGIPAGETLDITAYNECDSAFINLPPPDCDLCSIEVTVDDQMICPGDTATLTANVAGGFDPPLAYLWSTGETTESITVSPDAATTYGVTVTAGGPGVCVDSTTATVTIKPLPAIIILDTICEADTAYTLVFQTTDADSSNVSSATIDETFFGNGPHTLMGIPAGETLDITAYNECDSAFINLPPPDCDLCSIEVTVDDQMICPGDTATLTANVAGGFDPPLAYLWSTGETTESIVVSPDAATTYGVTVTAGGPGVCVDSTSATVNLIETTSIILLDTVCQADTAFTLTFSTPNADTALVGSTVFTGDGPHTVNDLPLSSVTIIAFNQCNADTLTIDPPDCDICTLEVTVADKEICFGDVAILTANVTGAFDPPLTYLWSNGETTSSISVSPAIMTTYSVTVTAAGPGVCEDSTSATVFIQPTPEVTIDSVYCGEDSLNVFVALTAQNIDDITTSAGTIESTTDPDGYLVTIPAGTVNMVTIIGSNNCGADKEMVSLPSCSACDLDAMVTNDTICPGEAATLMVVVSGGSGDFSTLWFDNPECDGDTLSMTATLTISPDTTTTYYVLVTDNLIDSCEIKLPATVFVNPLPEITLISNECDPGSDNYIVVVAVSNADTVTTSAGTIEATGDTLYTVTIPNDLSAVITATNDCGSDSVPVDPPVICLEAVDILATADGLENGTTIHIDQTVQLDVLVDDCDDCTFSWTGIPEILTPDLQNPVFDPLPETESGIYTFTVEVNRDADCCPPVQDTVSVCIIPLCEAAIFIPNAFTPNGDGSNDEFRILAADVDELLVVIYDRWGEKITELRSTGDSWDGTFRGEPLPSDVYGYYMEARCINGEEFFKKGNITLLK